VDKGRGRPPVAVIVPLGGAVNAAIGPALARLELGAADELLVVFNGPEGQRAPGLPERARIEHARGMRSSYHARNAGARASSAEWLLFLDGDCEPEPGLLDLYFSTVPGERTGAVAGRIEAAEHPGEGLMERHARTRELLDQEAFLARDKPFAVTANLLVRRAAWAELGGFREVRSGGDVDFSWRLQAAGWGLEFQGAALVRHRHRERLGDFLRQRVRYGAGAAWLQREHPGVRPAPRPLRGMARSAGAACGALVRGHVGESGLLAIDALGYGAHAVGARRSNLP
jgi:hypothetical protein